MQNEMRMSHVLIGEEEEADREQASASRQNNENENDRATDILFLRARAKFVGRCGGDREPGQNEDAQRENVPCGD